MDEAYMERASDLRQMGDELLESIELSRNILDNIKIIINVWKTDGTLLVFNKHAQELTGFKSEDVLGTSWKNKLVTCETCPDMDSFFQKGATGEIFPPKEGRLNCKNGNIIDVLWTNSFLYDEEKNVKHVISMGMDITGRKNIQKQLIESEERYRLALESSNDGLWEWNLDKNILLFSERCKEILEYAEGTEGIITDGTIYRATLKTWESIIHPEDLYAIKKALSDYINKRISGYKMEYRVRTKAGKYKWVLSYGKALWNEEGLPKRMAGSLTDITESKLAEEIIKNMAYFDSLTGLPNRASLLGEINNIISTETAKNFALLYVDLDNFKLVNDTLGHLAGDELLRMVAKRIKNELNAGEFFAKLGGDEFVLLSPDISTREDAAVIACGLMQLFKKPFSLEGHDINITASVGIALCPEHGQDVQSLLKCADISLYSVKQKGKNHFMVFNKEIHEVVVERMEMESKLRHALEKNELFIVYQPIIDIATGKIAGAEALARWNNEHLGAVPPLKFIPIAEETGMIISIGEWILHESCIKRKLWEQLGYENIILSINLSARQFEQEDLVENIKEIIDRLNIDPSCLGVEITESIAIKDIEYTIKTLNKIKELGIQVSLDDFGTGYSSLNYLRVLPIDTLKIDKSLLEELTPNSKEEVIVKTVIDLAQKMNLRVIAEGIETMEQLELLKNYRCDKGQGYLFSKPVKEEEFEQLLKKMIILP